MRRRRRRMRGRRTISRGWPSYESGYEGVNKRLLVTHRIRYTLNNRGGRIGDLFVYSSLKDAARRMQIPMTSGAIHCAEDPVQRC